MKSRFSFLFVILLSFLSFPQQRDVKIISSDFNSIVIEYTPVILETTTIEINNETFKKPEILFGFVPNPEEVGFPSLPERLINVGVPGEFGNTIQVLSHDYSELSGKIAPIPGLKKEGNLDVPYFEINSAYINYQPQDDLILFGEYGLIREMQTQSVRIRPIQYDPQKNIIRIYNKIVFRINFSSVQNISEAIEDDFTKDAVLNYNVAKRWTNGTLRTEKITTSSVLATGRWFRFEAPSEGIYKITYAMLQAYGIDAATVDPRTIKIYNNGGKMLPESMTQIVPTDLVENAIMISGEEDGVFNANDYILFYGRGTSFWEYDTLTHLIERRHHLYSKENYYWITSGGNTGKRIQTVQSLTGTADIVQTSTNAYTFLEEDKVNFVQSGRFYFSDEFNPTTRSRTYVNTLTGRIEGTPINYKFRFINNHSVYQQLSIEESGNQIYSAQINGTNNINDPFPSYLSGVPTETSVIYSGTLTDSRSVLKFTFNANSLTSRGHLDYFNINYQRTLNAIDGSIIFYSQTAGGNTEYQLAGFANSNIYVFDISDFSNVQMMNHLLLSGSEYRFIRQESNSYVRKYIGINEDKFLVPVNATEIANSDLHGINPGAEFIIITHKNFLEQANRLKHHRENVSSNRFSTIVVDIEDIFNEFSGGLKDVTGLRNFLKYAYQNWQIRPGYVLLLGDGDYDYRNIEGNNKNFILTYQVQHSSIWYRNLHHIHSYTTDDYFALINGSDPNVDIAIGRLNVQTAAEASAAIDKIILYESDSDRLSWKNRITLVADDGFTSSGPEANWHTAPSETLSNEIIPKYFNLNKIYSAAYPDVLTSSGRRKPDVNKAIIDAINEGTVILNYIGHGSPDLWAHEVIFDKNITIPQIQNDKFFFLTAATCDFGYYDIPNFQSATELMVLKENSGCIGAISSSRVVFAGENTQLMYALYRVLLNSSKDTLNFPITVGKVNLLTKEFRISDNDRKYHLFGDPTVRLQFPRYEGIIDSINGINPSVNVQIKALSRSNIEGTIIRPDSTLWSDFSGEGILTIFDSERQKRLELLSNYPINIPGGTIFRSRVSVQNGKFKSDFIVPKDISYENKNGKVVVYFYNDDSDGIIYTDKVIIGGTDSLTQNDGKGPDINIHFDSESYENANLINPGSTLIVKLSDETGLNTTGTGIGHKLEGILNDDENNPIDFTNYFIGDIDAGGRSGEINYKFSNIETGDYKLLIKAWDVFNNFSSETTYFSVVTGDELVVRDIYNYPNPFSSNTTFTFQHNLNSSVNLKIKIYSIAGRLIHEIERQNINDRFVTVDWDGRDMDGDLIANGTYLYKIVITTSDGQYNRDVLGKLAVIR